MNKITLFLFIIFFIPINALLAQEDLEIIEVTEDTELENIPFAVIDKVPVYPGCTGDDNEILKKCMSTKISAFVSENFDVKTASKGLPAGTYRVVITFKIDREGRITNIRSRGPNKTLETEAIKAIKEMPQMIPGQQRGINVGVLYALPLTFNLDPKDTDQNKGG